MFVERLAERLKLLLLRPAMPPETRMRLRQQRLDEEADRRSRYLLTTPDLSVTVKRMPVKAHAKVTDAGVEGSLTLTNVDIGPVSWHSGTASSRRRAGRSWPRSPSAPPTPTAVRAGRTRPRCRRC